MKNRVRRCSNWWMVGALLPMGLVMVSPDWAQGAGPFNTFTVAPCRVLDTRLAGGPIPANGSRNILVAGPLSGQGGASDCGVPDPGATGVFINVVAVNAGGAGHLTIYPFGTPLPLASTLNFAAGQTIANGVLVPICTPAASCTSDLTITMGPGGADVVIDVTGYLAP